MKRKNLILIVGTYGIDIFHGITDETEMNGCIVIMASTVKSTLEQIQNRSFDSIIINLEPDGHGGVAEFELLQAIAKSKQQEEAVCLGVSTHYPQTLPSEKSDKHLRILTGWLTLPIIPKELMSHIVELIESPQHKTIKELLA
ncbi:MAG: hypothetical protein ACJAWS_001294 [Oleiphilaceae bacterium]|jgi:hypothetical protein